MLTCWAGIVQSDGSGDVAGTVVMGRLLDWDRLSKLRNQINLSLDIKSIEDMPSGLKLWPAMLKSGVMGSSEFWTSHEDTVYRMYSPVRDIFNKNIGVITFDVPRPVHEQGDLLYRQVRLQLLLTVLIMTLLVGLAIEFLVVRRLRRLAKELDGLSDNSTWGPFVYRAI